MDTTMIVECANSNAATGTFVVVVTVSDDDGGSGSDSFTATVDVLNQSPVCTQAISSLDSLWPANHKFVTIQVLNVIDPDGDVVTIAIDNIFQDEPVDENSSGSTAPDGRGAGTSITDVRAERAGSGDGRVYHIGFSAADQHGDTCSGEVLVEVPHDRNKPAVDGGALYDSTQVVQRQAEANLPSLVARGTSGRSCL